MTIESKINDFETSSNEIIQSYTDMISEGLDKIVKTPLNRNTIDINKKILNRLVGDFPKYFKHTKSNEYVLSSYLVARIVDIYCREVRSRDLNGVNINNEEANKEASLVIRLDELCQGSMPTYDILWFQSKSGKGLTLKSIPIIINNYQKHHDELNLFISECTSIIEPPYGRGNSDTYEGHLIERPIYMSEIYTSLMTAIKSTLRIVDGVDLFYSGYKFTLHQTNARTSSKEIARNIIFGALSETTCIETGQNEKIVRVSGKSINRVLSAISMGNEDLQLIDEVSDYKGGVNYWDCDIKYTQSRRALGNTAIGKIYAAI